MQITKDISALIARIILGIILVAHGWQKFTEWTIAGTTESFGMMGAPLPGLSAPLAAIIELVGGILIIVGLATRWVGIIVALEMLGAAIIVHIDSGVFVTNGGWELVGAIGAAALALTAAGAGRFSLDHLIAQRRAAQPVHA
ncbi:DoxX family protein [Corynebacterium sp. S7]